MSRQGHKPCVPPRLEEVMKDDLRFQNAQKRKADFEEQELERR